MLSSINPTSSLLIGISQKMGRSTLLFTIPAWAVVLVMALCSYGNLLAQTTAPAHQEISLDQSNPFPLFDTAFYQNQLFLVGESHGVQKPQELDFAFFKHLNERAGVRYYVAEVDFVKAHYLNEYLKTGNDSTLMRVFNSWIRQQAQWANRDFVRKIQRIRAWNQTLPANRTVQFMGIDAVHDKSLTAAYLTEKLRGKKLSPAARLLTDSLLVRLTSSRPDSLAAKAALDWLNAAQTNPTDYRKVLGTDFEPVQHVIMNVSYLKTIPSRENTIVRNFKALYDRLNLRNQKLYGFWGYWHVLQAPTVCDKSGRCVHPMATQLRESDLPLHDRIVSITCSYVDCKNMVPTMFLPAMMQQAGKRYVGIDAFNNDGQMMHSGGIELLKTASRANTLTLFKLAGSEYGATPIKMTYSNFMPLGQQLQYEPTRPATDYFQYVVLVRNSDMTEPLVP